MREQKQTIIDVYRDRNVTDVFDSQRSRYAFQDYKHKVESDFLKESIKASKSKKIKVLDVACGTGRMLPEVFSTGKDVEYVGFDTSAEMTKHLKDKAKKLGVTNKVSLKFWDAAKLPFEDNEFDVVFTYHLLWHLPKEDQEKIIGEMVRVCKKGGDIIFDFLNKKFIWEKTKKMLKKKALDGIYKLEVKEAKKIVSGVREITLKKLSDAPIKNSSLYKLFNLVNKSEGVLPSLFYHMIFLKATK